MLATERDTAIKTLVKRLADKTFAELLEHCPKLVALVIEAREPGDDGFSADRRKTGFLRAKQTDLYGRITAHAEYIQVRMIKHVEPCSEVLEV